MNKIKTAELTGAALDWAVATCEGPNSVASCYYDENDLPVCRDEAPHMEWQPSTNWAQGGPIIEREGVSMRFCEKDARGAWYAVIGKNRFLSPDFEGSGTTPLIAAMRCYVASKLGDAVGIPAELLTN
jgi:hypothetical protein